MLMQKYLKTKTWSCMQANMMRVFFTVLSVQAHMPQRWAYCTAPVPQMFVVYINNHFRKFLKITRNKNLYDKSVQLCALVCSLECRNPPHPMWTAPKFIWSESQSTAFKRIRGSDLWNVSGLKNSSHSSLIIPNSGRQKSQVRKLP